MYKRNPLSFYIYNDRYYARRKALQEHYSQAPLGGFIRSLGGNLEPSLYGTFKKLLSPYCVIRR